MSIRLDPRRVATLKQLAADAGMRPGDLVRAWVEERVDAARGGTAVATGAGSGLAERVEALAARVAALEAAADATEAAHVAEPGREPEQAPTAMEPTAPDDVEDVAGGMPEPESLSQPDTTDESGAAAEPATEPAASRTRRNRVAAAPSGGRVALHDEMTEVLRERGPMTAAELAGAIAERGRYAPPRSGKPLDAAMVSQRVSNPTYRSRFVRQDGRIGLAE